MGRNVGLQVLKGIKANMPTLLLGEYYYCTDTKEHYIGDPTGNFPLAIPVYNAAGTRQLKPHMVVDTVTIGGGGSTVVTLAGGAAFTSATSYRTVVVCTSAKHSPQVTQSSGSSITFMGAGGDVYNYICIGI